MRYRRHRLERVGMQIQRVIFSEKGKAVLSGEHLDDGNLGPTELIIQSEASLISPGTETATYLDLALPDRTGPSAWPRRVGYANVGRVVAAGPGAAAEVGDRVFSMG